MSNVDGYVEMPSAGRWSCSNSVMGNCRMKISKWSELGDYDVKLRVSKSFVCGSMYPGTKYFDHDGCCVLRLEYGVGGTEI